MKTVKNKLRSKKGETFVEILLAILVVAFGCVLIATLFGTSMGLNLEAKRKDDEYYGSISEMETMGSTDDKIDIVITEQDGGTIPATGVKKYGNGEFTAYRK